MQTIAFKNNDFKRDIALFDSDGLEKMCAKIDRMIPIAYNFNNIIS